MSEIDASPKSPAPSGPPLAQPLARSRAQRRWLLVVGAILALAIGLALNWSWLVAAGIAPLILGIAPCAAMCALGLCMRGKPKR